MKFPFIGRSEASRYAKIHRNTISLFESGKHKTMREDAKILLKEYLLEKVKSIKKYIKKYL